MIGGLLLLAGVLVGLGVPRMPAGALVSIGLAAAAITVLSPLRRAAWPRRMALLLGGISLSLHATHEWQQLRIPAADYGTPVLLEGVVMGVPARAGAEWRFDAEVRRVAAPGSSDARIRRARLAWRDAPVAPRVGERWRWLVRVAPASETRNFVGVDVERAAFRDRVHLTGRVLPAALNVRLALAHSSIDTLRARIALRIADRVADPDAAALLTALAVGQTSGMSADQWRVFNATGTTHLVAISGLHVTLFAVLALAVARRLWRCPAVAARVDREPFAMLLGLAAAGGYALLAGLSVPTQRTWLMLAVFALTRMGARHASAFRTWSLALAAVLLIDVFAPLAAGFWLSFIAVAVLLAVETTTLDRETRAGRFLRLQIAVTLALAPLTFAVFGGVSLVGVGVNLVAIPVISFVFVPLVLLGAIAALLAPTVCGMVFSLAATLYEWLWPGMVWAADLGWAQWRAVPQPWWFVIAAPATLLLLWRWPWPMRLTGAAMLASVVLVPSRLPPAGVARVSVFDAGRGVAVLIATHTHLVLFDTGDGWNTRGTRMAQLVFPALDALGRRQVDMLVLPSLNEDRARGAALLASTRGVGQVIVGGGWTGTSLPVVSCNARRFEWDGVSFELLPAGRFCALRISTAGQVLLAGGDMDAAAEHELLARRPAAASCNVAILGRQASAAGSSRQWIEASGVGVRVIAAGGIPGSASRARTLARWREAGARILDTQQEGAIEFAFGTDGITMLSVARSARWPFAWRRVE